MNIRQMLILITLLPMIAYYLKLSFAPKVMATYFILGIPESIFWGVMVMFWGVFMAFVYVIFAVKSAKKPKKRGAVNND